MLELSTIVNRGKWLGRPVNIKEANKQAKIYVGRSLTLRIFCFMLLLCMIYIIAMHLLVSCMHTRNHLLYFARFCAGSTPKIAKKNIQQRTLPGFLTIFLYSPCFNVKKIIVILSCLQFLLTFVITKRKKCKMSFFYRWR